MNNYIVSVEFHLEAESEGDADTLVAATVENAASSIPGCSYADVVAVSDDLT